MEKVKKFKSFLESYSDDLEEVLSNEDNKYIVMKGDNILVGFEYVADCFDYLSELLEADGAISEEQKYEFDDYVSESNVDNLTEQDELEDFLTEILDKFEIVEPYYIKIREELEETPVDLGLEDEDEDDFDEDSLEDLERMLGESVENNPFCIVGKLNGKEQEIDSFTSEDEANEFLPDYKTIYNEFTDMRVINKTIIESKNNKKCKCEVNGKCTCGDKCTCGPECPCEKCNKSTNESLSVSDFMKIQKNLATLDAQDAMESWLVGYISEIESGTLKEEDLDLLRKSLEQYDEDLDELIEEVEGDEMTEVLGESKIKRFNDFK